MWLPIVEHVPDETPLSEEEQEQGEEEDSNHDGLGPDVVKESNGID